MSKGQSKELVRGSVEEILNELPEAAVASIQEQKRTKGFPHEQVDKIVNDCRSYLEGSFFFVSTVLCYKSHINQKNQAVEGLLFCDLIEIVCRQ